jgi:hypothetical protein
MTPERTTQSELGNKLLTKTDLNDEDLGQILQIGLEYASFRLEMPEMLNSKSPDFKKLFPYVVIGRMAMLYQKAIEQNLETADSIELFDSLRKDYIKKLELPEDIDNESLDRIIVDTICCHPDLIGEDELIDNISSDEMKVIRNWASYIVPDNPKSTSEFKGVEHILD